MPGPGGLHYSSPSACAVPADSDCVRSCLGRRLGSMEILNTKSRDSSFKHLAFLFVGLGIAAKGPAAFVLPLGVIAVECVAKRRWPNFLAIGLGVGIAACIVVPWYLATYSRHGRLFWDELVMRHMIGRTLEHLHDTNELEDVGAPYYLSQLGYGLFPWVMAIPFAFFRLPRAKGAVLALTVWAASSFVLFSMMSTKFHHYIAPAVPPIAGLLAIGLSEHMKQRTFIPLRNLVRWDCHVGWRFGRLLLRRRACKRHLEVHFFGLVSIRANMACFASPGENDRHPHRDRCRLVLRVCVAALGASTCSRRVGVRAIFVAPVPSCRCGSLGAAPV